MLVYEDEGDTDGSEFTFIIDDATDYHSLDDFRSAEARKMFFEWRARTAQYEADVKILETMRDEYAEAPLAQKQRMSAEIMAQELSLEKEAAQLAVMEKEIRKLEYKELNK